MKKKWVFRIAYLLLFVQLVSCRKSFKEDQLSQKAESLQSAKLARAPIPNCVIEKITSWSGVDSPQIARFYYNEWLNPVRVEFKYVGTGRPHLFFAYDKEQRLTDYYAPYQLDPNTAYEFWYNYTYDRSGERVLIDTQYLFGSIVDGVPQPNPTYKSAGNYEYDYKGRVSKVKRTYILQTGPPYPTFVDTYTYDTTGNLLGYGPYDYRTNMHRTNKVWQFIDRNYSVNNPTTAGKYNKYGYPLWFKTSTPFVFTFAYQVDLNNSEILYKCPQ